MDHSSVQSTKVVFITVLTSNSHKSMTSLTLKHIINYKHKVKI